MSSPAPSVPYAAPKLSRQPSSQRSASNLAVTDLGEAVACADKGNGLHQCVNTGSVQLDFGKLRIFEQVLNCYEPLGIQFEHAIAIAPSNPAFIDEAQAPRVLMPEANRSEIAMRFPQPIQQLVATVRSTSSVVLTAYDAEGTLIAQMNSEIPRFTRGHGELGHLPQQPLELAGEKIKRAVLYSDAPFVLSCLGFE